MIYDTMYDGFYETVTTFMTFSAEGRMGQDNALRDTVHGIVGTDIVFISDRDYIWGRAEAESSPKHIGRIDCIINIA